jgi:hypothetical protein
MAAAGPASVPKSDSKLPSGSSYAVVRLQIPELKLIKLGEDKWPALSKEFPWANSLKDLTSKLPWRFVLLFTKSKSDVYERHRQWTEKIFVGNIVARYDKSSTKHGVLFEWDNPEGDMVNHGSGDTLPTRFLALLHDEKTGYRAVHPMNIGERKRYGVGDVVNGSDELSPDECTAALTALCNNPRKFEDPGYTRSWAPIDPVECVCCLSKKADTFLGCISPAVHVVVCSECAMKLQVCPLCCTPSAPIAIVSVS